MHIPLIIPTIVAFIAGIMNSISGGGSFLTYPTLLLMGYSPIVASVTQHVALWPGTLASLPGYKKEIAKNKKWVKILALPCLIGGFIGSVVVLKTPPKTFGILAPILIFSGSTLLHYQKNIPKLFKVFRLSKKHHRVVVVSLLIFLVAIYGGYFGPGIGIVLLGFLTLLGLGSTYQTIGLKNVVVALIVFAAVIYYSISGNVVWSVIPYMASGAIIGGYIGSHIVHKIHQDIVRKYIVILGYVVTTVLLALQFIKFHP